MDRLPRIVILGGGMAGLTAAWELTRGDWRQHFESVTLYQRGWRLGGKGASSRGPNGRIEEHGLHILLGYYHETFRVMRSCYQELDRASTNPAAPITTWEEAVSPSGKVGLVDRHNGDWVPWVTDFGTPTTAWEEGSIDTGPLQLTDVVRRSLRLLVAFHSKPGGGMIMSSSPLPPARQREDFSTLLRTAGLTAVAGALELVDQAADAAATVAMRVRLAAALERALRELGSRLVVVTDDRPDLARTRLLIDLVLTNLRGIVADGLLTRPGGFGRIDDLDYREWLLRHGATKETIEQPIVRGMYDLVFAYEDGDPERPRFAAGLGLELATRMLLGHDGSIFWKMQAGMGEVIFAPIYEVLARRGVDFRFFHRVDRVEADADGLRVDRIVIGRQAEVKGGPGSYRPLSVAGGLPCWPDRPDSDQLVDGDHIGDANLESFWLEWSDVDSVELIAGEHFDEVVFAISLGMVPHIAGDLVAKSGRWAKMVDNVATVATQSFQLWLDSSDDELGWQGGAGVTLSGFAEPFDTWASMGHLIEREDWPADGNPGTIAYFCNVLAGDVSDRKGADEVFETVRENVVRFLRSDVGAIWPRAVDDAGDFRWERLVGPKEAKGQERLESQYLRANTDPSDRYVQSLPGTDMYRLRPGETGFANLVVAGDWTDCGLNAGCVEAATRSGVIAAKAVANRVRASGKKREQKP